MPELPEVEVLARHLQPVLRGRTIRNIQVNRAKILRPTSEREFKRILAGAKFQSLTRRGKYLLFGLHSSALKKEITLLGHLGMEGRMFVADPSEPLPKHAPVVLELDRGNFVFEDTRYFGRMTLDLSAVAKLGPEPWDETFTPEIFGQELKRSRQAIKVKLLDQSLVAGVGNIYASEALHRAGISPKRAADKLTYAQVTALHRTIRRVLSDAIAGGSTVPLNFGAGKSGAGSDGLFYFGRAAGTKDYYEERLQVYDRAGKPCGKCKTPIRRIVQAARSTYYCPACQKR